ncbi:Kelch-like protein 18 [Halotydeus destructor]|nr:Kelch-like protein 18 [Halotydeus destructor]
MLIMISEEEEEIIMAGSSLDGSDIDVYVYTQEDIGNTCFAMFEDLRLQSQLCDITITIEDSKFRAHRVFLSASIPYFHAMFTSDMVETKMNEITIQGIESKAFDQLLQYAYTGGIRICQNNVQSLLVGASFLQLQRVCDACCEYLQRRLSPHNVLGVKSFADTLSCVSLVHEARKYIQIHFEKVAASDEFLALPFNDVVDIISKDELNMSGEDKVFEAIIRWAKKEPTVREQYIADLLAQVRLPLLSPQYLADYVAKENIIKTCHRCRDLIDEAKDYHLMPERRTLLQNYRTRPRSVVSGLIYAVGGLAKTGDSLSTVEVFDSRTGSWKLAEAMTMLRSRVGVAVMGSKLYAIGGYNGSDRLSTVEVFDPDHRSWTKVTPMHRKRSAVGASTLNNNRLYVCGGYDGITSLNTVECYNLETNEWDLAANMSKHRSAAGVVAFGGKVYVLGGHDGLSIFDSVEVYEPQTNSWTYASPMLTKRCRLGVATLKGKIYVCGGYDGSTFLQTAEVYDPQTRQWSYIEPMNVMRSRVALVANCGRLYAIGGYDGVTNLSTVEVYDPETNMWYFVEPMCAHEGGVGVGVIPT